jgi:hypothetical protein
MESGCIRIEVESFGVVKNIDIHGSGFRNGRFRKRQGPILGIYVSADCNDRSDFAQGIQDVGITDITRVNDQFGPAQGFYRFGAEQPVGVGNQADLMRCTC